MDKFIVSARKYRPQTFDTVVGQSHITTTLKNAIRNNQLAHAFLFCGPRGVGKTTCARILAKTINCENLQPDGEACNECHSCKSFNDGISLNIHELDAASNNSVEDINKIISHLLDIGELVNLETRADYPSEIAGLRQISSPNKAQSSFVSEEYVPIVFQPLDKTERHRCTKRL